jgi:DNA polymerase-3 subunit epsilon
MREIVLDTETTGLKPEEGHRVVELGAIELVNHIPSGRSFHSYFDPRRDVPREAENVHGLTTEFLRGKPLFADRVGEILEFIADSRLIIHNAQFDLAFLNGELMRASRALLDMDRILDTLVLARQRHPMGPNSLDALCKRYGIDASHREKHGALLDAELLAQVYLELIGGRQAGLDLGAHPVIVPTEPAEKIVAIEARSRLLPARISETERDLHAALVADIGPHALWHRVGKGERR